MDISSIFSYTLYNDDKPGDYLVTPAVAYFCFDSVDFDFEKPVIEEDIYKDVKKEQKALRKKTVSDLTGTVYKLSKEQKRALKYLKKKYGKSLTKEIKEYRKKTLAPYQVAKTYIDRSKSIFPKDVFGMSKEEYLKYKKSAEDKIANMRSNRYEELTKEVMNYSDKRKKLDDMDDFFGTHDISDSAINKVFKKYGFYSTRFTEAQMREYQRKLDNIDKIKSDMIKKLANHEDIDPKQEEKLKKAIEEVGETKKSLAKQEDKTEKNLRELRGLSKRIDDFDVDDSIKQTLKHVIDGATDAEIKLTSKSFEQEYENFLMREKIRDDIRNRRDTKYVDDYKYMLQGVKDSIEDKRNDTIEKMAKERESKTFNEKEKKIYELKPGARKDSDRLSDYTLKIKEEDFFDPKYFTKSEELKDAERKIDAEIKRFERALEAKMDEKDFQLLRKYRLISNLITIKNVKPSDVYKKKEKSEESKSENEEDKTSEEN